MICIYLLWCNNSSMFISSYSSLCTGKCVVPHLTEEIRMDHFLGFEVDQRLARRGSSHQCRHVWASQTLLSQLSAWTLLSEWHSCSLGCDQCRMLSDILPHSTPLLVLVVTRLEPSSCEAQVTSASGRRGCYERKLFCHRIHCKLKQGALFLFQAVIGYISSNHGTVILKN